MSLPVTGCGGRLDPSASGVYEVHVSAVDSNSLDSAAISTSQFVDP